MESKLIVPYKAKVLTMPKALCNLCSDVFVTLSFFPALFSLCFTLLVSHCDWTIPAGARLSAFDPAVLSCSRYLLD